MDISKKIAELKAEPGFRENVGMVLVHNGVVRAWSRKDKSKVGRVKIEVNPGAAAAAGLRVSAKLLEVARVVPRDNR